MVGAGGTSSFTPTKTVVGVKNVSHAEREAEQVLG